MNQKLAQKTATFCEANIDFKIFMDNVFLIASQTEASASDKMVSLRAAKLSQSQTYQVSSQGNEWDHSKSIAFKQTLTSMQQQKITKQLLTLCSCLSENPLIYT
jgi:hypothetical protein